MTSKLTNKVPSLLDEDESSVDHVLTSHEVAERCKAVDTTIDSSDVDRLVGRREPITLLLAWLVEQIPERHSAHVLTMS